MSGRRPKSLEEVDVELEEAIERLRDRVRHVSHGRGIVVVERFRDETMGYRLEVDPMTEAEVQWLMQAKPKSWRRS